MKPIAIIGLGNFLMGDEGVGIHATKKLRENPLSDDIDVIDAGVPSLALLHMMEGRQLVIVIDCADFGGEAGEITTFTPDQVKQQNEGRQVSLHGYDLMTTFDIAAQAGMPLPPVWIVGIQPSRVEMTMELSEEAAGALEHLPHVIRNLIEKQGPSGLH
jgi:hydrogenase maturation protease